MNILTFDIEDWYNCDFISRDFDWDKHEVRINEGVGRILDELDKRGQKGTFFCLGWLAEHHPDVIRRIAESGHQVGCHSYQHELATRFTPEEFHADTIKAKNMIEQVIGMPLDIFRAPGFSVTEKNSWAIDVLADLGFKYDCSVFPSHHDYGGMPNYGVAEPTIIRTKHSQIKEFPVNIHSVAGKHIAFSGGGFFRFFPYPIIKTWAKQSDYMMTYFHPRDFDPDQPIVKGLPLKRRFKSYVGLKTSFHKWQRLLDDFEFVNVEEADRVINWEKVRVVEILVHGT